MVLARAKSEEAMEERRNWATYIASYCQQVIPAPYFSTEDADIDSKTENNGDKGREEVDHAIRRGAKAQWLDGCCRISLRLYLLSFFQRPHLGASSCIQRTDRCSNRRISAGEKNGCALHLMGMVHIATPEGGVPHLANSQSGGIVWILIPDSGNVILTYPLNVHFTS